MRLHVTKDAHNSAHVESAFRRWAAQERERLRKAARDNAQASDTSAHALVERMRRKFKAHRSAVEFDFKFIRDA